MATGSRNRATRDSDQRLTRCGRPPHTAQSGHLHHTYDDLPRPDASGVTGLTDGDLLFQACHLVSQMPLVPLEVFGSPFNLEEPMARTYEYWTVKDGEDISIKLTVAYYSARKGNFSSQAAWHVQRQQGVLT